MNRVKFYLPLSLNYGFRKDRFLMDMPPVYRMKFWILTFAFLMMALAIPNLSQAETYYISPSGSSSNNGLSSSSPWKTFGYAIPRLQPGDTLMVMDGTYSVSGGTGLPSITCGSNANNGFEGQPITIRAENERAALLQSTGDYHHAFYMNGCSYWNVIGLSGQSADLPPDQGGKPYSVFAVSQSDHITLQRLLAAYPNRYGNSQAIQVSASSHSLVEECEAYDFHRHGISIYRSDHITVRRCYVNSRSYADIPGGCPSHVGAEGLGDEGITLYQTTDSIVENCVSEGNEFFGNSGQRNRYLGSIALNNLYGFVVGHHCCEDVMEAKDNVYTDNVVIGSKYHGFLTQSDINTFVDHLTSMNNIEYYGLYANNKYSNNYNPNLSWYIEPSLTVQNSLFLNNRGYGISVNHAEDYAFRKFESLNSYGHKQNYGPGTEIIKNDDRAEYLLQNDPQIGPCMVFIPKDSPMKGAGKDGADIGANILYRYQDGTLTNQPLWNPQTGAFPCGEVLPGLNDLSGSSCSDVHERLNVNANGCSLVMAWIPPVNHPPVAEAGDPQTVKEGVRVVLDGMNSYDPDEGDRIEAYGWFQVAGPSVTLSDAASAQPQFTAPKVTQNEVLRFQLIVNDGTLESLPDTVDITVQPAFLPVKMRINAGGGPYVDTSGNLWAADQPYAPGSFGYVRGNLYSTKHSISGTEDDPLYKTERWGSMSYRFDVPNGDYQVKLLFAEIYLNARNKRKFDVYLEGRQVLDDLDIYSLVGHDAALVKTFTVTVSDGRLDIDFKKVKEDPKISAIEVRSIIQ
jgi:hypothetical protein